MEEADQAVKIIEDQLANKVIEAQNLEEKVKRAEAWADEAEAHAHQIEEEHASMDTLHEEHMKAIEAQVEELREKLKTSSKEAVKKYLAFEEF